MHFEVHSIILKHENIILQDPKNQRLTSGKRYTNFLLPTPFTLNFGPLRFDCEGALLTDPEPLRSGI